MDALDKAVINQLQEGFPVCEHPFEQIARKLGITEESLMQRLQQLLDEGIVSRFGPLYNIERFGGAYSLIAMQIPVHDLDRVIRIINNHHEVAHNYERDHRFNIWFVTATETKDRLATLLEDIETQTGYKTYNMPKLDEYYIGLRLDA